jgi:hypothetical protein
VERRCVVLHPLKSNSVVESGTIIALITLTALATYSRCFAAGFYKNSAKLSAKNVDFFDLPALYRSIRFNSFRVMRR